MKATILAFALIAIAGQTLFANPGFSMAVSSDGTILSGGPTAEQAEGPLKARIAEQSGGDIKLDSFKLLKSKFTHVEIDKQQLIAAAFEADVVVTKPCRWSFQYRGQPLQFRTTDNQTGLSNEMRGSTIAISKPNAKYRLKGAIWFRHTNVDWLLAGFSSDEAPVPALSADETVCRHNLQIIGTAFKIWSADNNDKFPFNVPAEQGGTLALCSRDPQGFEKDPSVHFRILGNELGASPKILVCSADTAKKPASNFQTLTSANVSYKLHTGSDVTEEHESVVLAECPIHGWVLLVDGTVKKKGE